MGTRIVATPPLPEELLDLARAQRAQVPELSARLVDLLREKTECYRRVADEYPEELRKVCEAHLDGAFTSFIECREVELDNALKTGRAQARIGITLPDALRAYRLAGTFVYEMLIERGGPHTHGVTPERMLQASTTVWKIIDAYSEALTTAYREVEAERGRLDEQAKSALMDGLLEGRIAQRPDLEDAAGVLGLPTSGKLVVIVADDASVVDAIGSRAVWRRRVHSSGVDMNVGIMPVGAGLDALREVLTTTSGVVGVSTPFADLTEVPTALHRARIARRSLPHGANGVVVFGDLPVAALVAGAPALAAELAHEMLAGVLALPPAEREILLTTLETWYDHGGSAKIAAKNLYVHPNTVRYRIRRIEDLTGRDLNHPKCVAELYMALQAVRLGL
ncbi:PucR family transcriptional regulator [Kibdelosporangium aridum]|uniref:PucR family transcriptional regulator n=1 Tax=Kibdelosporangium aridum TaxID=2030 RepID=UPI0005246769